MFCRDEYLGCEADLEALRCLSNNLNAKVVRQLNDSQELVMMNSFAHENNEYIFKASLQERLSDIASWRWVLEDLDKRLQKAIEALEYEHNALLVVVQRIRDEINLYSEEGSRPGALRPLSDVVEEAILQSCQLNSVFLVFGGSYGATQLNLKICIKEHNYLLEQKKIFEKMTEELPEQIARLEKNKKRIQQDLLNKQQAFAIDEACGDKLQCSKMQRKRKGKASPVTRWEQRCASLKRAGLRALCNALIIRQQVKGSRVQLTISAQAYATRVDTALRRRLHINKINLDELTWQKDEAIRDLNYLKEELLAVEKNLLETLDKERLIESRLADRSLRPAGEHTKDDVDRKLKDEQERLKHFKKHLRDNIKRIIYLQNHLTELVQKIDCCIEDLAQVMALDEHRIKSRHDDDVAKNDVSTSPCSIGLTVDSSKSPHKWIPIRKTQGPPLEAINEDEEDDYPFDE